MDIHKTCKICGETKSVNNFYKSQRGLKCKDCTLKITKVVKLKMLGLLQYKRYITKALAKYKVPLIRA